MFAISTDSATSHETQIIFLQDGLYALQIVMIQINFLTSFKSPIKKIPSHIQSLTAPQF